MEKYLREDTLLDFLDDKRIDAEHGYRTSSDEEALGYWQGQLDLIKEMKEEI